jgi:hypothetical protein
METTTLKLRCWFIIFSFISLQSAYGQCQFCPGGTTTLTNKVSAFTISSAYCASGNVTVDDLNISNGGTLYIAQNSMVTIGGNLQLTGTGNIVICRKGGVDVVGTASFSNTSAVTMDVGSFFTLRGALLVLSASASINMANCSVMEVCGSFTLSQNNIFKKTGSGCNARFITRAAASGTGTFTSTSGITWVDDANSTIPKGSATYCGQFAYFSSLACAPAGGSTCGTAQSLALGFYNAFALPVTFTSFKAIPEFNRINVNWQTATETNSDYFTVQRSSDGLEFSDISTIKSKAAGGYSSKALNYSFMDELTAESYYYRVKQTDFDGNVSYSQLTYAKISGLVNTPSLVWPNPASNSINIPAGMAEEGAVSIVARNVMGTAFNLPATNNDGKILTLNTADLNAGVYYISLNENNITRYQRLVIKR